MIKLIICDFCIENFSFNKKPTVKKGNIQMADFILHILFVSMYCIKIVAAIQKKLTRIKCILSFNSRAIILIQNSERKNHDAPLACFPLHNIIPLTISNMLSCVNGKYKTAQIIL